MTGRHSALPAASYQPVMLWWPNTDQSVGGNVENSCMQPQPRNDTQVKLPEKMPHTAHGIILQSSVIAIQSGPKTGRADL